MRVRAVVKNLMPFAAMAVAEVITVAISTISKAAMSSGMSHFVLVAYSNVLGTLLLLPALFFAQRKSRPPITFLLLGKIFGLSFIGIAIMLNLLFTGISYSSPTLSSVITNLVPAQTFLLAAIFRMEKVNLRCFLSQIKILGTIVTVLGALTMTLYKGPELWASLPVSMLTHTHPLPELHNDNMLTSNSNWVFGSLLLVAGTFAMASSNILQVPILKGCPSEITFVFFYELFGTTQCIAIALVAERDPNSWKLRPDVELLAVLIMAFCGILLLYIIAWCIVKKGPVFVSIFKPLEIALAALTSAIFLGDTLYIGSVVGAVITLAGFYGVIWAQSKEKGNECIPVDLLPASSSQKTPLLDDQLLKV